jgi:hypothetical protein
MSLYDDLEDIGLNSSTSADKSSTTKPLTSLNCNANFNLAIFEILLGCLFFA